MTVKKHIQKCRLALSIFLVLIFFEIQMKVKMALAIDATLFRQRAPALASRIEELERPAALAQKPVEKFYSQEWKR